MHVKNGVIGWRVSRPYDPRILDELRYAIYPIPREGPLSRPGYSLAEAATLVSTDRMNFLVRSFALWGRRADQDIYRAINRDRSLKVSDVDTSKLIDNDTGVEWSDVRFIPPIFAPNVHEFADGIEFSVAFWRLVLFDVETKPAFDLACNAAPPVFHFVMDWRPFGLDQTLKIAELNSLASLCRHHLHSVCENEGWPNVRLGEFPTLVARRAETLLLHLAAERISSDGFYKGDTRERIPIDPVLWTRSEYAIDLRKGDLVNVETGETEWSAIVLRAPELDVEEAEGPQSPRAPSPTNKAEHIAVQLLAKFGDRRPGLKPKEMCSQINLDGSIGTYSSRTMQRALRIAWGARR
jgi:hypothetical protein